MKTTSLPQNRFKGKHHTHFITNRVFSWKIASPQTQTGSVRSAGFVSRSHAKKSSWLNRLKQSHVSLLTYLGTQNEKIIIIIIIIIIMAIIKKHDSCERVYIYLFDEVFFLNSPAILMCYSMECIFQVAYLLQHQLL